MRKLVVATMIIVVVGAACVPPTDEVEPRGAAGVAVEPSAASRGEPFVTSDGWTLRIEQLGIVATVSAYSTTESGSSDYLIFDGTKRAEGFVRAMPVGACAVSLRMSRFYYSQRRGRPADDGTIRPSFDPPGSITDALWQRLTGPADDDPSAEAYDDFPSEYYVRSGPGIVFIVRAERNGEVKTLDLALASFRSLSIDDTKPVVVPKNNVVFADVDLLAERIFGYDDTRPDDQLVFDPIADIDRKGDNDGIISVAELRAARRLATRDFRGEHAKYDAVECTDEMYDDEDFDSEKLYCANMLELISWRTADLFRLR